jgi:hypothetical protein
MTPPKRSPLPQTSPRPELHRRVKRGIVAGYLHGLTQRHGAGIAQRPLATPLPRAVPAAAAAQPVEG